MYAISVFFLGTLFYEFIGPDAVDYVKMPLGLLGLQIGETHGVGKVVMINGTKLLEVPLWRSYLAGCILLGIAPCTAMLMLVKICLKTQHWFSPSETDTPAINA